MRKLTKNEFMRIKRMNNEQLSTFLDTYYKQAYSDGMDKGQDSVEVVQMDKDTLFKTLCEVRGVSMITANKIVQKLTEE